MTNVGVLETRIVYVTYLVIPIIERASLYSVDSNMKASGSIVVCCSIMNFSESDFFSRHQDII